MKRHFRPTIVGFAALGVLVASGFAAPADKETPPVGGPPKPFTLPATDDFTLPNGMSVTIVPYGQVPKVAVRAYIDAGSSREGADQVWLSKLNALLMKEGTATRSAEQVAREAAEMGGQLEVSAGSDYTFAGGLALSEFGPRFVALLADVLQHPSLPASELSRLKADLGRQLAVARTEPNALARERFMSTLLPNQPYGRVYPTEAALTGYDLASVKSFYDANFAAKRTHLYIAGKLDPGLKQAITDAFGNWKAGEVSPVPPANPVRSRSVSLIDRPAASQSTIYMGLPVPEPSNADYITVEVMDSLLGSSFASRITSNIREQKGYTYSPYSLVDSRRGVSYWAEIADVTTADTGASLKEIFYEVDRLRKDPPSETELKAIQGYLTGTFVLRNTISPDAVISQIHFVDAQNLQRSWLSTYIQKVVAVTPGDIQRVTESYIIPSKMTVVIVGDKAKVADQLKPFEAAQ